MVIGGVIAIKLVDRPQQAKFIAAPSLGKKKGGSSDPPVAAI